MSGRAIQVEFCDHLRVRRGQIDSRGTEVHAATFLRRRLMILDRALQNDADELARIFLHEVFHFTWTRLGNPLRLSFEKLLESELSSRARGELGWSAESRKQVLSAADRNRRSRKWREYCCESFCDTGAFLLARNGVHPEFTLAPRHCGRRRTWFQSHVFQAAMPV